MNAQRYNLIFYNVQQLDDFLMQLGQCKGKNISNYHYAFILHDKDIILETGELKKEHFHLWLEFPDSVKSQFIDSILTKIGVGLNALSHQKTDRNFLAYLTHDTINSELKARYNKGDIFHNFGTDEFNEMYYDALAKVNKPTHQQKKVNQAMQFYKNVSQILNDNKDICNYSALIQFLIMSEEWELLEYATQKAYAVKNAFSNAFKSNQYKTFTTTLENEEKTALNEPINNDIINSEDDLPF